MEMIISLAKRDIAIFRRDMAGRPTLEVTDLTRLCVNCNRYILEEIDLLERDPTCMRINVLTQTRSASCLICNQEHDVQRLSLQARVNSSLQTFTFSAMLDLVKIIWMGKAFF